MSAPSTATPDSSAPAPAPGTPHASATPSAVLTIDVEDWFQVENLKSRVPRQSWDGQELRVERNTMRLLELMAERNVRATYFILGWVAERLPQLVRTIADAGHEVASHGYGHELVYHLSPARFREDVRRSVDLLEQSTGRRVWGYRAPSFSITDWAIDVLQELGLRYDSSCFPAMAHDRYGSLTGIPAGATVHPVRTGFDEVTVSCLTLAGRSLPWGGGGYFRLLPYPLFRWGIRRILQGGSPYVFYLHPWEIDAGQPRVSRLPRTHAFRHYVHVEQCERDFTALLQDFEWIRMQDLLGIGGAG